MSRSTAAVGLLLLPALLALPFPADAQTSFAFTVNVLYARSFGCSPDGDAAADLRVQVLLNDVPLILTPEARDRENATYGARADTTAALPARLTIQVDEGQPSPDPNVPSALIPCDLTVGAGHWYNLSYSGGAADPVVLRGDGPNAAEVVLYVGTGVPTSPTAAVTDVTASSASLLWDRARGALAPSGHRIARGAAGEDLALLPADATTATLTGLCDNHAYSVRVLRDAPPWILSSQDVPFTTANVPPEPARVLRADPAGANLTVAWESRTLHDVGLYEVHVGATSDFTPTADTLRGTATASRTDARGSTEVARREGDAYVRVRTKDVLGLNAVSDAFAIGGAAQAPTTPAPTDPCTAVRVEAPGAIAVAPPTPPPATTTPTLTTPTGIVPVTTTASPTSSTPPATTPSGGTTPAAEVEPEGGNGTPLGPAIALVAALTAALLLAGRRRQR